MDHKQVSARGGSSMLRIAGPESRHVVLLLPGVGDLPDVYDGVAEKLHNSDLKTIAVEDVAGLDQAAVLEILDELSLPWVHLVGSKEGAELAWSMAARTFGKFTSLVVCDRPHPAIADETGTVLEAGCPAVELPTTLMIGSSLRRAAADGTGRLVYGDFRVVELDGVDDIPSGATSELATEIVLRTSPW
ncbi:alpha/beta hydrolase [Rhodococcus sp. G-MC3]|uniref:alpha/beta hydrolase n=1 Tax=Rhodococcus sp. G-MC3 TaxID=3046209 RepID=UPI0024BA3299|nr:alpha/beta hydrolase [Rhodococcus sp. G-MC3]MDJ0391891.1 alpha/beta hydrolase [Rhodococcus sp. G-MC3]